MKINKSNFPYFYEDTSEWVMLPSGIEQQIAWEYTVGQAIDTDTYGEQQPIIVECLRRKQRYRFEGYCIVGGSVDEWRYLDGKEDDDYASTMRGYRAYWEGQVFKDQQIILQPDVAVMLCLTPDPLKTPSYIKSVTLTSLLDLLSRAELLYHDDARVTAYEPRPISAAPSTPEDVVEAMHQLRMKANLLTTRGRAALLKMVMEETGVELVNGGWQVSTKETARRQKLMQ